MDSKFGSTYITTTGFGQKIAVQDHGGFVRLIADYEGASPVEVDIDANSALRLSSSIWCQAVESVKGKMSGVSRGEQWSAEANRSGDVVVQIGDVSAEIPASILEVAVRRARQRR